MSIKEEVQALIERLPDDVTLEDIQYHVFVYQKIAHGRAAAAAGETVPHSEVVRRMAKWTAR
jgi:predicted transcriptional regulator